MIRSRHPQIRDEAGFTMVEVLIAVMLLAVIATGVSLAMVGGSRLQGRAKVNASLASASRKVVESLRSDRAWMKRTDCRNTSPSASCNLLVTGGGSTWSLDTSMLKDNDLNLTWRITTLTAKGVDSAVDGLGTSDKDAIVPDYFRITMVIAPPDDATRARLGNIPDLRFTTALDERGNIPEGSIEVDICAVRNQIDERMTISDCGSTGGGSAIRMDQCPPAPLLGCTAAWNSVKDRPRSYTAPSPNVEMVPVSGASFTLVDIGGGGSYSSSGHEIPGHPGHYLFDNLKASTYRVQYTALPGGTVRWPSHDLPTDGGNVSVEPDSRAKSLIMLRPSALATLTLNFRRKVTKYTLVAEWKPCDPVSSGDQPASCDRKHELVHHKATETFEGEIAKSDQSENFGRADLPVDYRPAACGTTIPDNTDPAWSTTCQYFYSSVFVKPGWPRDNCAVTYWVTDHYLGPVGGHPDGDSYIGGDTRTPALDLGSYMAYERWSYCSYYDTWLQHRVWHEDPGQRTTSYPPGAYQAGTYWIHSAPDHRQLMDNHHNPQPSGSMDIPNETLRDTSNPSVYFTTAGGGAPPMGTTGPIRPVNSCLDSDLGDQRQTFTRGCNVVGYAQVINGLANAATSRIVMNNIPPGLYTSVQQGGGAALNHNLGVFGGNPFGAGGIWVSPTGGCGVAWVSAPNSTSCSGTMNANVTLTGQGECYWRSPGVPGGAAYHVGACSPCKPYWSPSDFQASRCYLIDKSRCRRRAYVEKFFHLSGSGEPTDPSIYSESWKDCDTLNFNPPLMCMSADPRADLSGCVPGDPGPPPRTSYTEHDLETPNKTTIHVKAGGDATTLG